ncbi:MAG: 1-acyl-sn-glycerol-3-phosphate acyltransferase [Hyphomonadaceae bacterium]|nr:1-acyl-sn-glycerol-3-phosphate acyltransferase [Hyphomonadaceae bacterium]
MRSLAFNILFWIASTLYVLLCAALALLPGRGAVRWGVRRYVRRMVWLMRTVAGIAPEARGRERLPAGPFIIAAKHSSYGDGFVMMSQFDDLAFVTGDHLERFPFMAAVLDKLGAIVVDNCGGPEARKDLSDSFKTAAAEGRPVLIYPEGHLARVGEKHRYRSGVWHMQETSGWPVVPVATNLGLRWQCEDWEKTSGVAVIEFLDPIPAGLPKAEFMDRLERAVETHTARLLAEGRAADAARDARTLAPTGKGRH